jgi:hypothetical protein
MKNLQLKSCARTKMFFIKTRKMSDVVVERNAFSLQSYLYIYGDKRMFRW